MDARRKRAQAANGEDAADSVAAICTDFTGIVSGVRIGIF